MLLFCIPIVNILASPLERHLNLTKFSRTVWFWCHLFRNSLIAQKRSLTVWFYSSSNILISQNSHLQFDFTVLATFWSRKNSHEQFDFTVLATFWSHKILTNSLILISQNSHEQFDLTKFSWTVWFWRRSQRNILIFHKPFDFDVYRPSNILITHNFSEHFDFDVAVRVTFWSSEHFDLDVAV